MIRKRHLLYTFAALLGTFSCQAQTDLFPTFDGMVNNAALTHTGDKIVFILEKDEGKAVFESEKVGDYWTEPKTIPILTKMLGNQIGGFSFNHDGNKLFFHAKTESSFEEPGVDCAVHICRVLRYRICCLCTVCEKA